MKKTDHDRGNGANDIRQINDWLQYKLSGSEKEYIEEHPGLSKSNTAELLKDFVKGKIVEIKQLLGSQSCRAVTIRSEFRSSQDYLRPTYSFPAELSPLLEEPAFQKPFSYEYNSTTGLPFSEDMPSYPKLGLNLPATFIAIHKVSDPEEIGEGVSVEKNPEFAFGPRINSFWNDIGHSPVAEVNSRYIDPVKMNDEFCASDKGIYCLFTARNAENLKDTLRPQHIAAIYFVAENKQIDEIEQVLLSQLHAISESLFDGIALIERIDSALFELEGLQLVAKLLPKFTDSDIAPADKISLAIGEFGKLVANHIIGRTAEGAPPKIFYMNCAFEHLENEEFVPRLSLYPLVYRHKYPLAATQVSHRSLPSASKFLLKCYLEADTDIIAFGRQVGRDSDWQEAKLAPEFVNLFTSKNLGLSEHDEEDWLHTIWKENRSDILHMVEHDSRLPSEANGSATLWSALNKPSSPEDQNRSIVAYVVKGEKLGMKGDLPVRSFPRGILAIESKNVAAFSDTDVGGLRTVLSGFSSLIRIITHQNSPVDYRPQLSAAFDRYVPNDPAVDLDIQIKRKFIFLAHTIDGFELHKLNSTLLAIKEKMPEAFDVFVKENFGLTPDSIALIDRFIKCIDPAADQGLSEKEANEHITRRVKKVQEFIKEILDTKGLLEAINFLEACTENFLWSSYIYSLGQALGDRINQKLPKFHFMRPGYSASQMFMAIVENELKQVVKLSSKSKLEKERRKYLDFVRYRVVNAARIPVNAFAFDSDGLRGMDQSAGVPDTERKYRDYFGVLVSDLVFAKDPNTRQVATLVSTVVDHLKAKARTPKGKSSPSISQIQPKIRQLFTNSLDLWKRIEPSTDVETVVAAVRSAYRLPKICNFEHPDTEELNSEDLDKKNEAKRKADLIKTYEAFVKFSSNSGMLGEELKSRWSAEDLSQFLAPSTLNTDLASITHGDMNARNLAWAAGLNSFFLIDFEHVGYGIDGTDQMRLVVNLTTDLFGSFLETTATRWPTSQHDEDEIRKFAGEIDTVLTNLPNAIKAFLSGGDRSVIEIMESIITDGVEEPSQQELWGLIVNIVKTLPSPSRSADKESYRAYNYLWGYCLFCSCLKEFEYSLISIDEEIELVLREAKKQKIFLSTISSADLFKFLWTQSSLGEDPSTELLGKIFRYFVAGKLLYGVIYDDK